MKFKSNTNNANAAESIHVYTINALATARVNMNTPKQKMARLYVNTTEMFNKLLFNKWWIVKTGPNYLQIQWKPSYTPKKKKKKNRKNRTHTHIYFSAFVAFVFEQINLCLLFKRLYHWECVFYVIISFTKDFIITTHCHFDICVCVSVCVNISTKMTNNNHHTGDRAAKSRSRTVWMASWKHLHTFLIKKRKSQTHTHLSICSLFLFLYL